MRALRIGSLVRSWTSLMIASRGDFLAGCRLFFVEWIFYSTCRRYLNQVEELTKIYIQRRLNRKFSPRKYHQDDNQPDLYRFNLVAKTLTDSTEIYVPRVTLTVVKIIEPKGFLGTRGQSPIEKVQVVRRQSVRAWRIERFLSWATGGKSSPEVVKVWSW